MRSTQENKSTKGPFKNGGMFEGASPLIFQLAKNLRRNMTHAEKILWMHLKSGVHGLKFRRQHPIGIYIADFYCHKIKLIVEADGGIHETANGKQYDEERRGNLSAKGYNVVRFKNHQIERNLPAVLAEINSIVEIELQKLNEVKI